ncbi:MAG: RHS repeat-associated core domain-containing protein, partial [Actinomycetota bacterium]|nr:RHS repeat-associated core domain-containing protein [Actinomycetota bacterium]
TYSYDGDGNRLVADAGTLPADETRYQWDPNNPLPLLIEERDGNNNQTRAYLHGHEQISMETGGARSYYLHDQLGSTLALTSPSGAIQRTYDYLPFGQLRNTTQPDPLAPENVMRFTGQLYDAQTGLYHLRARQYDPTTGRFTATDPVPPRIEDPYVASYIYANNRPTVLVDPSGEITLSVCASGAFARVAGASGAACYNIVGGRGWHTSIGGGLGYGESVGLGLQLTTARSVRDLNGLSASVEGGFLYFGGGGFLGTACEGSRVAGVELMGGIGRGVFAMANRTFAPSCLLDIDLMSNLVNK